MSKNAQGYMGIQVGKLGPAVGFMWKGKNVYRGYNPFAKNPKTGSQVAQRNKFKFLSKLARLLSPAINRGYDYNAKYESTTERGLFMRDNANLLAGTAEYSDMALTLDENLKLSTGPMLDPQFGTAVYDAVEKTISVPYSTDLLGCADEMDSIVVLAVNADEVTAENVDQLLPIIAIGTRSDGSVTVHLPDHVAQAGNKVALYGFAHATNTEAIYIEAYAGYMYPGMSSDSQFIGTLTL